MLYVLNDPPVYPPTTGEEPIASPGPQYPIPVWGTPEAAPTSTATILEFPNTGAGDESYSVGLNWQVGAVLIVLLAVAADALLWRRRN